MTNDKPSVLDRPDVTTLVKYFNQLFAVERQYRHIAESADVIMADERWIEANNYINYNSKYLRAIGPDKIDKKNLARLIDAISADGKWHFNMATFFGVLNREEVENAFEYDGATDVSSISANVFGHSFKRMFNSTTNSFNCDSVGCIAGFASAIALGWNDDAVRNINKTTNPNKAWEHIACNFLNIPLAIGEKIFFGEKGSIWSFLKTKDPRFDSLTFSEDTQYGIDNDYVCEGDWQDIEINLLSIEYKKATEMLSMILEEEIKFNEDFDPYFTDKYYQNNPNMVI